MDVELEILAGDGAYCLARYDQTLITVWRGVATVPAVDMISSACEALLATANGGATYISVLERASPSPSESVRSVLAHWTREVVPMFASAVAVPEGGGFRAALVRGVLLALTVIVPHRVPFKFSGSVVDGAELLAPFLRHGRSGADLVRAIEQTRLML